MKITAKIQNDIPKEMESYLKVVERVAKRSYDFFVRQTPIDTGNARRNTKLNDTTIEANYNYASALDKGWSKQAPDGMSAPTMDKMEKYLDEEIKKIK